MRVIGRLAAQSCALIGVFAAVWALYAWARCWALPVAIVPLDCLDLYADGRCELFESRQLSVRVALPDDAGLIFWDRARPVRAEPQSAQAGPGLRFYKLTLRHGVRELWAIAWSLRGLGVTRLKLLESTEPLWLRSARTEWIAARGPAVQAELERQIQRLGPSCAASDPPCLRGPALGLLGNILGDAGKTEDAKARLREALIADRQAGRIASELYHIQSLSDILGRRQAHDREAEQLFRERQDLFDKMPCLRPWEAMHMSFLRFQRGDLKGALAAAEQGRQEAIRFNDQPAQNANELELAAILAHLGRFAEAKAPLQRILATDLDPCTRLRVLHMQGFATVLEIEARGGDSKAIAAAFDPLTTAETLMFERRCGEARPQAVIWTDLAHAAMLRQDAAAADTYLRNAMGLLSSDSELQWEWFELQGRIALLRQNWAEATQVFGKLRSLSQRANAYESQLRALLGLALAAESSDVEQSLKYYAEAHAFLDERALTMPMGSGHSSYLGSYQRGTQLALDLLYRNGRYNEAIELIRTSRLRGLRALARVERINRFAPTERQRYEQILAAYHEARRQLAQLTLDQMKAPGDTVQSLQTTMREREGELWSFLTTDQDEAGPRGQTPLRPIPERELLLTCHPKVRGWVCLLASPGHETQAVATNGPPTLQDLAGLLARIDGIKATPSAFDRLSIYSFGQVRDLNLSLLPFWEKEAPLGSRIDVVYGLDLPEQWNAGSAAGTQPPRAYVLADPHGDLKHARAGAPSLATSLSAAGWQVDLQVGAAAPIGGLIDSVLPAAPVVSSGDEVRKRIKQSRLFFYNGHASYSPLGGWRHRLEMPDQGDILVGDILTMSAVPETVLLFACESGRSDEETGGLEGMGLAQAFLWAGSHVVLASTKEVRDEVMAAVAEALAKRLSASRPVALGIELTNAVQEVRQLKWPAEVAHGLDHELGAFRVFHR